MMMMMIIMITICSGIIQTRICKSEEFQLITFEISKLVKNELHWFLQYKALRSVSATTGSHLHGAAIMKGINRVIAHLDNYTRYNANMLFKGQRTVFIKLS